VGVYFLGDENVVSGEYDLRHDIAFVSEVFDVVFGAQVIETDGFGVGIQFSFAVFLDYIVTVLDKFETDVSTGFYIKFMFG
jgi:hypothetical protein